MNPLDAINNLVNQATTASTMRWLVCRDCANIQQHDMATMPPAACPQCNGTSRITAGTEVMAQGFALKIKNPEQAAANNCLPLPDAAPVAPVAPPAAPEKPKRGKKAPAAAEAKVAADAVTAPTTPDNIPTSVDEGEIDWGRKREMARDQLFAKFPSINAATWTPVTTGKIQTFGFGTFVEGAFHSDWMEVTDTPNSFSERFKEAKRSDPGLSIDLAKVVVCEADEEAFTPFAFQNCLTCSLRPLFRETVRPMVGARVVVGARLGKTGKLQFAVVEVRR
jgi:hypothetical protein